MLGPGQWTCWPSGWWMCTGRWPWQIVSFGEAAGVVTPGAATATALAPGLPVFQGLMDSFAAALACDVFQPGRTAVTLGSSSSYMALTPEPVSDLRLLGLIRAALGPWHLPDAGRPDLRGVAGPLVRRGTGRRPGPGCAGRGSRPGAAGQRRHHRARHLAGQPTPFRNPLRRGAFTGLALGHGRPHLHPATWRRWPTWLAGHRGAHQRRDRPAGTRADLGRQPQCTLAPDTDADVIGLPTAPARPGAAGGAGRGHLRGGLPGRLPGSARRGGRDVAGGARGRAESRTGGPTSPRSGPTRKQPAPSPPRTTAAPAANPWEPAPARDPVRAFGPWLDPGAGDSAAVLDAHRQRWPGPPGSLIAGHGTLVRHVREVPRRDSAWILACVAAAR